MSTHYEISGCPICGGRGTELLADEGDVREEIEALWEYHTAGDRDIPADELADRVTFSQPPPLAVVRCIACGVLYRNPRERYVREIYEGEALTEPRLRALGAAQRDVFAATVRTLTDLNAGPGRALEVGSYAGAFLDAAAAAGWHVRGVDVNTDVVAYLRAAGHDVQPGGIEQAHAAACDVVAFWNCFEQLPEPAAAARAAHARLRPGGILALRVPNGGFYAALRPHLHDTVGRAVVTLLARHNFLGFPYRHGFTRASLARMLGDTGFEIVHARAAEVLPLPALHNGALQERMVDAAELALRPFAGPPWLELYARRL